MHASGSCHMQQGKIAVYNTLGRTSPGHANTAASGYAASKVVALVVESRSCGGFSTVGAGVRAGLS